MNYHVDFDGLENYKEKIDKCIDILGKEIVAIYKAHEELIWQGDAYNTMTNNLYERLNTMNNMVKILDLISQFIDTSSQKYSEGLEEIKKNFEKILEEIREEKRKRGIDWEI